jgi:hypothetical protein
LLAEAAGEGGGEEGNGSSIADYAYASKKLVKKQHHIRNF